MKAYAYPETGAARNVLHRLEKPLPALNSEEVRIKVFAPGIDPLDRKRRSGQFMTRRKFKQRSLGLIQAGLFPDPCHKQQAE